MTLDDFKRSLSGAKPPPRIAPALAALWWVGKDDWDTAHKIVMDKSGRDCAWVHAHLHRMEGDAGNAAYWYAQARKPASKLYLRTEWDAIASELLRAS